MTDPRGIELFTEIFTLLMNILDIVSPEGSASQLKSYLKAVKFESDITKIGASAAKQREFLSKQVNMPRMSNNPIGFTGMHINQVFDL